MAGRSSHEGVSPARRFVLGQIADRITGMQLSHPTRVGFDGIETSGKTSLADALVPHLEARGRLVIRVLGDEFRNPRAIRYRQGDMSPKGYYEDSVDHEKLLGWLLNPLGPEGNRRYRLRALEADKRVFPEEEIAPDNAIVVVDGLFLFRPEYAGSLDYRVFVTTTFDEAKRRAVERDTHFGTEEEIRARYEKRFHPAQRAYHERVQPHKLADAIIDNNDWTEPKLIFPTA